MGNKNKSTFKQTKTTKTQPTSDHQNISTYTQQLIRPPLNIYTSFLREPTRGKLLILLFFVLPWNLGKHFEVNSSYINGVAVSYLMPTLYLQDILILLVVVFSMMKMAAGVFKEISGSRGTLRTTSVSVGLLARLFFLFILSCMFSLFFSARLATSVYFFSRLVLYFLFFITSGDLFLRKPIRRFFYIALFANMFLLCLLGSMQFQRQSSFFNNYLFFGEQPYDIYTAFVAKESYNGVVKIPPYGTFEHPNTFAGYLTISVLCMFGYVVCRRGLSMVLYVCTTALLLAGVVVLYSTKSSAAWVALGLGVGFLIGHRLFVFLSLQLKRHFFDKKLVVQRFAVLCRSSLVLFCACIVVLGLAFPLVKNFARSLLPTDSALSALSVDRRAGLLTASYSMVLEKPFFGWGLNSFTYSFLPFYTDPVLTKFYQPVHNVFALALVEVGVLGCLFFLSLIFYTVYYTVRHGNPLYSAALLQVIFLASFDHYFFTAHQLLVLFILTLLLSLTYTDDVYCL